MNITKILDARQTEEQRCAEQSQKCSLAMLYSKDAMPAELTKAHATLDKTVDNAYN